MFKSQLFLRRSSLRLTKPISIRHGEVADETSEFCGYFEECMDHSPLPSPITHPINPSISWCM